MFVIFAILSFFGGLCKSRQEAVGEEIGEYGHM